MATAIEMYATEVMSQSAQEYIEQTVQNDIDRINYDISSAMDDMFAMMIHLYHNEPELFEKNLKVWKETADKVLSFRDRLSEATDMADIKNQLRRRKGGFVARLVGGGL